MPQHDAAGRRRSNVVREAAVALIRIEDGAEEYLILRRALDERDPWSGHFSLPGGRRDPSDPDLLATCLRETREECGVQLGQASLLRILSPATAGNVFGHPSQVTPFLFTLPRRPTLVLDAKEIAAAHWVTVDYLRDPANQMQAATLPEQPGRLFPGIRLGDGFIWGFTYKVLQGLLGF